MIKQIILPLLGVIAFIVVVGLLVRNTGTFKLPVFTPSPTIASKTVVIGEKSVSVEVANTRDSRVRGLSGRESLDTEQGMLFVFDSQDVNPIFWMKDMLISLDIIWINDNKIVKIDKNVPFPPAGAPDSKLATYSPGQPIDYVLELNAGYSDLNDLRVGDNIKISGI